MNSDKLTKMQESVRIGGKGTARRKKKVLHRTATTDDKKLQSSLKKLSVNNIPGIEEVNMMKNDGSVIHFNNPKVQASLAANTFAVTGQSETKQITEMLPGILNQLGAESLQHLKRLATSVGAGAGAGGAGGESGKPAAVDEDEDDDDDVPDLVENFDEASKNEASADNKEKEEIAPVPVENSDDVPDLVENLDEAPKVEASEDKKEVEATADKVEASPEKAVEATPEKVESTPEKAVEATPENETPVEKSDDVPKVVESLDEASPKVEVASTAEVKKDSDKKEEE